MRGCALSSRLFPQQNSALVRFSKANATSCLRLTRLGFVIEPLETRIAPAFAAVFELASLDGLSGFKLSGVATGDASGYSISAAGDVNGDGFDDVIVGAAGADSNGADSGASYVVFGRATGFSPDLSLSALDGSSWPRMMFRTRRPRRNHQKRRLPGIFGKRRDDACVLSGSWRSPSTFHGRRSAGSSGRDRGSGSGIRRRIIRSSISLP